MEEMPIWPCEQCNGTGYMTGGGRCGCREEDDEAEERRRNFQVILGGNKQTGRPLL